MNYLKLCEILGKYLPAVAVKPIADCVVENKVFLKICRPRASKLGDYRSPAFYGKHTITINNDLNQYAFAITLLHELSHMLCYNQHQHKVKPHGAEWKKCFVNLSKPIMDAKAFPNDIHRALSNYFQNPAASTCADPHLLKVLNKYDKEPSALVDDVAIGTLFELENGRVFKKGEKRRTRYLCTCQQTNRMYLVSGVAKIKNLP